jgi:hypothetical protein
MSDILDQILEIVSGGQGDWLSSSQKRELTNIIADLSFDEMVSLFWDNMVPIFADEEGWSETIVDDIISCFPPTAATIFDRSFEQSV